MDVMLHICCSVCTAGALERLRAEGHRVTGFFYNPNIHPLLEFRRRLKSVKVLQERVPVRVIYHENYGLRCFLEEVDWSRQDRCADCYRLRLQRAAEAAAERGMDALTTTLLTSDHQHHDLLAEAGRQCAEACGIEFLYRDWRDLARENRERAGEMGLYLQQYCGCVFSEYERFKDTGRHLYRGDGPAAER